MFMDMIIVGCNCVIMSFINCCKDGVKCVVFECVRLFMSVNVLCLIFGDLFMYEVMRIFWIGDCAMSGSMVCFMFSYKLESKFKV